MKKDALKVIAEKYRVSLVYLFGSRADTGRRYLEGDKGSLDLFSDLDVAVSFDRPPAETMKTYGSLYKEISELFVPFAIDLLHLLYIQSRSLLWKTIRICRAAVPFLSIWSPMENSGSRDYRGHPNLFLFSSGGSGDRSLSMSWRSIFLIQCRP